MARTIRSRSNCRYNTSENHKKVALAIADMWAPLGVNVELSEHRCRHPLCLSAGRRRSSRSLGPAGSATTTIRRTSCSWSRATMSGFNYAQVQQSGVRRADGPGGGDHRPGSARRACCDRPKSCSCGICRSSRSTTTSTWSLVSEKVEGLGGQYPRTASEPVRAHHGTRVPNLRASPSRRGPRRYRRAPIATALR